MFCKNCGAQVEDGKKFCPKCGTPMVATQAAEEVEAAVENVEEVVAGAVNTEEPKPFVPKAPKAPMDPKKKKMIIIGGAAAAAVVVIAIVLILLLGGGGYEGAIKDYYKAIEKGDGVAVAKAVIPESVMEDYLSVKYKKYDDVEELGDYIADKIEDYGYENLKYEIKLAENFEKIKKLKTETNCEDLDDFRSVVDRKFRKVDEFDADKITEAWAVKVKVTGKSDEAGRINRTFVIAVYKYEGDWYVHNAYPSFVA